MDIAKLSDRFDERVATKDFGAAGSLTVTYCMAKVTPELEQRLVAAFADPAASGMVLAETLAEVVIRWDLTEDGVPIPVTRDRIARLSYGILVLVWTTIREGAGVGEANGGTSDAG